MSTKPIHPTPEEFCVKLAMFLTYKQPTLQQLENTAGLAYRTLYKHCQQLEAQNKACIEQDPSYMNLIRQLAAKDQEIEGLREVIDMQKSVCCEPHHDVFESMREQIRAKDELIKRSELKEKRLALMLQVLHEYKCAVRGDWSLFDGRSNRDAIEMIVNILDDDHEPTLEGYRITLDLCPAGNGHWTEHCYDACKADAKKVVK